MNPLYNAGIALYGLGAKIGSWRSGKIRKMLAGQRDTLDTLEQKRKDAAPDGYDVWVHAASLGEFEQARPLIERLRREQPQLKILLTFFSPSGYEVRKNYSKVDTVAYLPFDTPGRVRRFLDAARPKMAIFAKYEFWGNYLEQLRDRQIPTYIISAIFRPSQPFFKWWGGAFRKMLRCYDTLYVQDDRSKRLLGRLGVDNVVVAGDTRFDRVTDVMLSTVQYPLIERWKADGKKVLVVGSSWQPDEICYLPYLMAHPEIKAIVAPHEFDAERLRVLKAQLGRAVLFSDAERDGEIPADAQAVVIDSFGKLSSLYRYGDVALIGGGFGAGIHNLNEAAVYGLPVVFGPKHHKFKEADDLIACRGGFEYVDEESLQDILDRLFAPGSKTLAKAGAAAGAYIHAHLGATDRIYADLFGNANPKH